MPENRVPPEPQPEENVDSDDRDAAYSPSQKDSSQEGAVKA